MRIVVLVLIDCEWVWWCGICDFVDRGIGVLMLLGFLFLLLISFKRSSNGQGGQSRMGGASLNSESNVAVSNARITQNGAHAPSQLHGIYKFLIFLFLQTVVIFFYHDFVVLVWLESGFHNSNGIQISDWILFVNLYLWVFLC